MIFSVLLLVSKPLFTKEVQSSAITYYGREAGRLGDLLRLYVKTKWMAYRHKVPLLHKPFPFSDQFELHYIEKRYNANLLKNFKKRVQINHDPDYIDPGESILYEVGYSPFIKTPWGGALENPDFIKEIKKLLKPHKPLKPMTLPKGITTVALHVRKGGGFDFPLLSEQIYSEQYQNFKAFQDKIHPLKFPPDQYYIDQINRLSKFLSNEPLYIYLFTDDQNPQGIINRFKKYIKSTNIIFDCRKIANHHSRNIIEDFFAITQFDYMIRGASHYAEMADIIGNHQFVIYPCNFKWQGNRLIITEIKMVFKDENDRIEVLLSN